ncbi:hypothetical protein FPV67DRAFT_1428257, partial [Lyophyllum atratum]
LRPNPQTLVEWKPSLNRNFRNTVFAACTFNTGSNTVALPHRDYNNYAPGWCAITALGSFDPDKGGHLVLWDLRLVIRFPPGSTTLIPSAMLCHSNTPIQAGERRYSFTQYSAGGLFRWVDNGCMTSRAFEASQPPVMKSEQEAAGKRRWRDGLDMMCTYEELLAASRK